MSRVLTAVSAAASGTTQAVLTFTYTGTYDGGNNSSQCGGGSGEVIVNVYKRDVTGGGSFTLVGTVTGGGPTGPSGYTVAGLTDGRTWEFRCDSLQRRMLWNAADLVCVPTDTGPSGNFTSNQIAMPSGTLSCTAGSFALSGQAVGLRAARTITAAVGTYVLTGQAAGLGRGRTLSAEPGSYTLSGQAAVLRADKRFPVDAGSFALTGQPATLRFGYSLSVEAGSYTLTGGAARFTYWARPSSESGGWSEQDPGATDWTPATSSSAPWAPQI